MHAVNDHDVVKPQEEVLVENNQTLRRRHSDAKARDRRRRVDHQVQDLPSNRTMTPSHAPVYRLTMHVRLFMSLSSLLSLPPCVTTTVTASRCFRTYAKRYLSILMLGI